MPAGILGVRVPSLVWVSKNGETIWSNSVQAFALGVFISAPVRIE